jgi:hypothetical protein
VRVDNVHERTLFFLASRKIRPIQMAPHDFSAEIISMCPTNSFSIHELAHSKILPERFFDLLGVFPILNWQQFVAGNLY